MNWPDERYVRLYTRDTPDWLCLSFLAQGLLCLLLRKVDRAGVMQLGKVGRKGAFIAVGHGHQAAMLDPALDELLADGCVEIRGDRLVVPNFIEAQEAEASDKARARKYREKRRDQSRSSDAEPAAAADAGDAQRDGPVTPCDAPVTVRVATVTPNRAVPSVPAVKREAKQEGEPPLLSLEKPKAKKPTDPRHRPFLEALVEELRVARGSGAALDRTKDPPAVTRLLAWSGGDTVEARRRFRAALEAPPPFRCDTIAQFATARIWNHFAPAGASATPPATLRPLAAPGAR